MSAAAPTEAEVEELNKRIRELESVNVQRLRLERGTSERVILNMLGEGGGSSAANSPRSSLVLRRCPLSHQEFAQARLSH
ncbi:hypothetical protein T484DRAFT_1820082 [Baffinella frigidus]|nr:hypothetical protein T484DRAFT_1820082 [Cryptophyta sp. CCMP2293]